MIPWILIIVGAIFTIIGVIGLFRLYIILPISEKDRIVFKRDRDFIFARLDSRIQNVVDDNARQLKSAFIIFCFIGIMMFVAGIYFGYAAEGEGFWFYKKFYPEAAANQVWDELNEQGQFVAEDGKAYTYYILVSGNKISLSGEECQDYSDLKERLSKINRENTVIIIDSFAVSSTYKSVRNCLNELGIKYEETR